MYYLIGIVMVNTYVILGIGEMNIVDTWLLEVRMELRVFKFVSRYKTRVQLFLQNKRYITYFDTTNKPLLDN